LAEAEIPPDILYRVRLFYKTLDRIEKERPSPRKAFQMAYKHVKEVPTVISQRLIRDIVAYEVVACGISFHTIHRLRIDIEEEVDPRNHPIEIYLVWK